MKNLAFVLLSSVTILFSSCIGTGVPSISDITLNEDVKKGFRKGKTPERNLFQYGQNPDTALDIVVPLDPTGSQAISKSHNYYVSKGSQVEFNMETLLYYRGFEVDVKDLEEEGELLTPLQWISTCSFRDPITGKKLKDVDGDEVSINFAPIDAKKSFKVFLKTCKNTQISRHDVTYGGPLTINCDEFQMGGSNDRMIIETAITGKAYPLCMLGGRLVIDSSSTFTREVVATSYNDVRNNFEKLTFSNEISPTFFVVDKKVKTYSVYMRPDPDNGPNGDNFLRYEWNMPTVDGLWKDNFASDINIEFIRFYWTNSDGQRIPIMAPEILGSPPHNVQVNVGRVCSTFDQEGYFRSGSCDLFSAYTPASPKGDLTIKTTWRLSILFDEYYYELNDNWMNNVVMEFGIKAN